MQMPRDKPFPPSTRKYFASVVTPKLQLNIVTQLWLETPVTITVKESRVRKRDIK
jgi:hypothetical protein